MLQPWGNSTAQARAHSPTEPPVEGLGVGVGVGVGGLGVGVGAVEGQGLPQGVPQGLVQPKGGLGVGVTGVAGEAGATGQGLEGGQAVPPVQDTICANASATAVAMAVSYAGSGRVGRAGVRKQADIDVLTKRKRSKRD